MPTLLKKDQLPFPFYKQITLQGISGFTSIQFFLFLVLFLVFNFSFSQTFNEVTGTPFTQFSQSNGMWIDLDNDYDQDLFIAGSDGLSNSIETTEEVLLLKWPRQ
jgi:hypothetical protein